ncbi:putative exonuclease GOR [Daphnia pulicaria]|uniref:putative exonuclease GOR n=1 Tax=Daphnia pulicaria TaxID=35523 RepID=UPI001EEC0EA5|nr:putative exonuclease GOR [Daphnia pulicaria]
MYSSKSVDEAALFRQMQPYVLTTQRQELNGFPRPDPYNKDKAIINSKNISQSRSNSSVRLASDKRICDRCSAIYQIDYRGMPLGGDCSYHWGRSYQRRGYKTPYTCCNRDSNSAGCTVNKWHISENLDNLRGFVRTVEKPQPADGNCGIYALDCEMCYTTEGGEALRVTVVSSDCKTVYDTLIKPINPVLDYNTRFSGITENDLTNCNTTMKDVQTFLLDTFSDKTILIGHSLDGDLRALRLIHDTVIDTSVVFPHSQGLPFKRALKTLCQEYLHKTIQIDGGGHNCVEDAKSCMELMIWKINH